MGIVRRNFVLVTCGSERVKMFFKVPLLLCNNVISFWNAYIPVDAMKFDKHTAIVMQLGKIKVIEQCINCTVVIELKFLTLLSCCQTNSKKIYLKVRQFHLQTIKGKIKLNLLRVTNHKIGCNLIWIKLTKMLI